MRPLARWAGIVVVGLILAGCVHRPQTNFDRPFVLFWTHHPEELVGLTHVTPQVDLDSQADNPAHTVSAWQACGVTPLAWKGGWCYKDRTEDEFVADFSNAAEAGHLGIAIDEWGGGDPEFDHKFGRALVRTKQLHPDLFIAVWCFGLFRPRMAGYLRDGADVVMIERYIDGATEADFGHWFRGPVNVARDAEIIHKTVFALGINDTDPKSIEEHNPWANTPAELEAQMRWIHDYAPEMPGIAFFAPRCSTEMRDLAAKLAVEIFGENTK